MTNAFPLTFSPIGTTLVPPENPGLLTGAATATLAPGISAANEWLPLSAIEKWLTSTSGSPMMGPSPYAPKEQPKLSSVMSWFGARGVMLILGLLLVAAGLFSLNPVKEKIILAGKTAAKAAAVAA